jgi:hypothetical protein
MRLNILFILLFSITCFAPEMLSGKNFSDTGPEFGLPENKPAVPDLNVFPNPVKNGNFWIVSDVNRMQEVRLINITGTEVYIRKFVDPVQRHEVNIKGFPEGIYLLAVKQTNNSVKTIKILVSNQ